MEKFGKIIGIVIGGVIMACLLALLTGWIVMLLWNWLVPVVFAGLVNAGFLAGIITYWQGWGLAALGSCLFGMTSSSSSN